MNAIAAFLLSIALQASYRIPAPTPSPQPVTATRPARKGGRWYLAESGHAVYCLGPVRLLPQPEGGLQRVATFCEGDKNMVPLKD